jgi:hypothetical protein
MLSSALRWSGVGYRFLDAQQLADPLGQPAHCVQLYINGVQLLADFVRLHLGVSLQGAQFAMLLHDHGPHLGFALRSSLLRTA